MAFRRSHLLIPGIIAVIFGIVSLSQLQGLGHLTSLAGIQNIRGAFERRLVSHSTSSSRQGAKPANPKAVGGTHPSSKISHTQTASGHNHTSSGHHSGSHPVAMENSGSGHKTATGSHPPAHHNDGK